MSITRTKAFALIGTLALGFSLGGAQAVPHLAWAEEALSPSELALTEIGNDEGAAEPTDQVKQGWQEEDGAKRYYDADGSLHKGWLYDGDSWYWLDKITGNMATGWQHINGYWYWLDEETGIMATSRTECSDGWSDFASSGEWQGYASGWDLRGGFWHWLENGKLAHGWRLINGSWYWMDESGNMRTGWIELGGARYHLSSSGAMNTGWLFDSGNWYWLDPNNGDMRTGWQRINSRWYWADTETGICAQNVVEVIGNATYAFDASCAMGQNGWSRVGDTWYWAGQSGALEGGWHLVRGSWYWMDPESKAMATGLIDLSGTKYYMTSSGAMATGWAYDKGEGCWYYAASSPSDGHLLTGWQLIGGRWYWMDGTTAKMQTGWLTVSGKTYHLSTSGAMDSSCWIDESDVSAYVGSDGVVAARVRDDAITLVDGTSPSNGLVQVGNTWFYVLDGKVQHGAVEVDGVTHLFDETTGRAITGWRADESGVRHHYDEKGVMQTGWVLDGSWYLLDSNGVILTGWQKVNSSWYWLDTTSGAMKTGWLKDGDTWYWLSSSGSMSTGWIWDGSHWYYMSDNGAMKTGWINLGGYWYWLDTASGAMGTGWIWDGNAYYFCASDGHWVNVSAQWQDMFNKAQGYSSATNYLILVDTANCRVGVYQGSYGSWTPTKEFICSPGAPSTPTVKGQFTVQEKGYVFGSGYSCYYYTQFYGAYLFHSVLYRQNSDVILDGRLGQQLSHGCVRLAIENAKWIYDYIPRGTKVVIW